MLRPARDNFSCSALSVAHYRHHERKASSEKEARSDRCHGWQVPDVRDGTGKLLAVSDLHVSHRENREIVASLRPESAGDWLLVAGDVADITTDVAWALGTLRERFETVVWSPGNHELWTHPSDPIQLRGEQRYRHLVDICRSLGVLTPEDPYPVWHGAGGPAIVAPLFVLYDHTFLPDGATTKSEAIALAASSGVVCTDEWLLHPDPHPSREAWCQVRIEETLRRLEALDPVMPTVLMNHFPLVRDPTRVLRYPEFAQWCGTEQSAEWHLRFRASAVVYGHLHIPRTTWHDGVRFEEVSLGYPSEWRRQPGRTYTPRQILPLSKLSYVARSCQKLFLSCEKLSGAVRLRSARGSAAATAHMRAQIPCPSSRRYRRLARRPYPRTDPSALNTRQPCDQARYPNRCAP